MIDIRILLVLLAFYVCTVHCQACVEHEECGKNSTCIDGQCVGMCGGDYHHDIECPDSWLACDGVCVDIYNDSLNCGFCNLTCFNETETCVSGVCTLCMMCDV